MLGASAWQVLKGLALVQSIPGMHALAFSRAPHMLDAAWFEPPEMRMHCQSPCTGEGACATCNGDARAEVSAAISRNQLVFEQAAELRGAETGAPTQIVAAKTRKEPTTGMALTIFDAVGTLPERPRAAVHSYPSIFQFLTGTSMCAGKQPLFGLDGSALSLCAPREDMYSK